MKHLLTLIGCCLALSLSAQADINDYMNAQVTGTEIFMEYDHQKMLDEIDAQNVEIAAQNVLLGSVAAPAITSGATGTDLWENTGAGQTVYTITATAATATATWPAPTFAIGGTDFDAGSLSLNASTGVVTLTVDPVYASQSSYSFTVTAIDAANNTSAATAVTFDILNCGGPVTVTYDNHSYATVLIGTQCWFAENLRSTSYSNGDEIPGELDDSNWSATTLGARTVYGEGSSTVQNGSGDETLNLTNFGRLYNAYAVDDNRGLCPNDWHVPTHSDWADLEMELGMSEVEANATGWRGSDQGSQLKASSSDTPSWNGTNSSQFSGLPGGYRSYLGNMVSADLYGVFWCQEMNEKMLGGIYDQVYSVVYTEEHVNRSGFSVRCVRD